MGEGLGQMLAAEPGVAVDAVDIADPEAVDAALRREPSVIVVEEGGAVDAADVVRRSDCPIVMDVDITTTRAWTLRREQLAAGPDDFLATIRAAVRSEAQADARSEHPDLSLQPVQLPG
jgi:hypothetical protein